MIPTTKKLWWAVGALAATNVVTLLVSTLLVKTAFDKASHAKQEETLAKVADNRMLRARSNFVLPGFTPIHLERVTRNADTYGIPWWIPAGIGKNENGGDTLEVGMQSIPMNIRKTQPVMEWQYSALMRMINQQAWRVILSDPELLPKVIIPFAQIYKAEDPQKWLDMCTTLMVDFRNIEDQAAKGNGAKSAFSQESKKAKQLSRKNFRKKFRINPKLKQKGEEK